MKRSILSLLLLLFFSQLKAQPWLWSQRLADSTINQHPVNGNSTKLGGIGLIVTDDLENIITVNGLVFNTGQIPFPVIDTFMIRLAKYDKHGTALWIKYFEVPAFFNFGSFRTHVYDIRTDRIGNIYLLMRNFNRYDKKQIGVNGNDSIQNALYKINAQGKFIWKKPVGQIEDVLSYPQFAKIAVSPDANHLYAYVDQYMTAFPFLDSTFARIGNNMMLFCKADSSGRVVQWKKFPGAQPSSIYSALEVNKNNEVLITGAATENIILADTTLLFQANNPERKNFIAVFRGNDLSRKWTRTSELVTANSLISMNLLDAKFSENGNIAYLFELAKTNSDPATTKSVVICGQTVSFNVANPYENPSLVLTDASGNYITNNPLHQEARTLVFGNRLSTDKANNYYTGGNRSVMVGPNERFIPVIIKANSTGARSWVKSITGLDSLASVYPMTAGQTDYPVVLTGIGYKPAPVFGPDTLSLPNCTNCGFIVLSGISNASNVIRGTLYRDENLNGVQDINETGVPNLLVTANNGQFDAFTDYSGKYSLVTDIGNFQVTVPQRPRYYGCNPVSQSVSFASAGNTVSNKNFALTPDTSVIEVGIDVTQIGPARPGSFTYLMTSYYNEGIQTVSNAYTLKLDPGIGFVQSDSLPVFTSTDSIRWNYVNLRPGDLRTNLSKLSVSPGTALGSVKKFAGSIFPYTTDTIRNNNMDTAWVTITGSYDPNDKLVYPAHAIRIDSVQQGKQPLEYTIRFQNTGTDTAFYIHIIDTLSAKLDLSSIKLLAASHSVEMEWQHPNILHFYYRHILLPDSNRNEPASHGFAKFRIYPKNNLTTNDTIYNRASIYFDYNLPVMTNTTSTYFRSNIITSVTDPVRQYYQVSVNPNPANNELNYLICCFNSREPVELAVFDMAGRKLITQTTTPSLQNIKGTLRLDGLPQGTYLLKITGKKGFSTIGFIKQR